MIVPAVGKISGIPEGNIHYWSTLNVHNQKWIYNLKLGHMNSCSFRRTRYFIYTFSKVTRRLNGALGWLLSYLSSGLGINPTWCKFSFFLLAVHHVLEILDSPLSITYNLNCFMLIDFWPVNGYYEMIISLVNPLSYSIYQSPWIAFNWLEWHLQYSNGYTFQNWAIAHYILLSDVSIFSLLYSYIFSMCFHFVKCEKSRINTKKQSLFFSISWVLGFLLNKSL